MLCEVNAEDIKRLRPLRDSYDEEQRYVVAGSLLNKHAMLHGCLRVELDNIRFWLGLSLVLNAGALASIVAIVIQLMK